MKGNHYKNLKIKILISFIIVPFVPFLIVGIINFYYFSNSLQNKTISTMRRIVDDHRQMINFFLNERKADLQFILDSHDYSYLSSHDLLQKTFANLQKKSSAFVDLGIFNREGLHVAYTGPYKLTGKTYREADWFREVMRKGYYISDVFLGYRRVPHFIIALLKDNGGRKWVIRSTIDTMMFSDMVEKVLIGKTGEAFILNNEGILQTRMRSGGSLMSKIPESSRYITRHKGIKTFIEKNEKDETCLYATAWLKDDGWMLTVRQEKSDAFSALHFATTLAIIVAFIGGVSIVGMAFYMSDRIIRQIIRTDEEKGKLSQQLIVASRLAEIGEMSAGFAHEINNPLQIIRAEQTLIETILSEVIIRNKLEENEDIKEILDSVRQIKVQIDRCAEITQSILKFARPKSSGTTEVDLKVYIPEILKMLSRKANIEGISIKQEIPGDIPSLVIDASLLQQVMINLLNNAIFAITEKHGSKGGALVISARKTENRVEISIEDNGSGISPEDIEKIFMPFFSTKPVGKGTGLGLSICRSIIDKMGGVISVSSQKDRGTIFIIHLPLTAA